MKIPMMLLGVLLIGVLAFLVDEIKKENTKKANSSLLDQVWPGLPQGNLYKKDTAKEKILADQSQDVSGREIRSIYVQLQNEKIVIFTTSNKDSDSWDSGGASQSDRLAALSVLETYLSRQAGKTKN